MSRNSISSDISAIHQVLQLMFLISHVIPRDLLECNKPVNSQMLTSHLSSVTVWVQWGLLVDHFTLENAQLRCNPPLRGSPHVWCHVKELGSNGQQSPSLTSSNVSYKSRDPLVPLMPKPYAHHVKHRQWTASSFKLTNCQYTIANHVEGLLLLRQLSEACQARHTSVLGCVQLNESLRDLTACGVDKKTI